MNQSEFQRRDQLMRAYFQGRDWDGNKEFGLKRHLILNSDELLPDYPFVIDDEWEVEPNESQKGKGDLVFTNGAGQFAVVEVKWIDLDSSGKTVRTRRTKNRKEVAGQAANYAQHFCHRMGGAEVKGYFFTNEDQQPQLAASV